MQAPPNSAAAQPQQPVHIHVVDSFNLDESLDVASVLLTCKALVSCEQIRISTSGLHPNLAAHPSVAASLSSSAGNAGTFSYDATSFADIAAALGWTPALLKRNVAVASADGGATSGVVAAGPRHFTSVERECRAALADFVSGANDEEDENMAVVPPYFDVILCCSRQVYDGLCAFYRQQETAKETTMPHVFFLMHIDDRFIRGGAASSTSSGQQQQQQPQSKAAAAKSDVALRAHNSNVSALSKPSLGQIFSSLIVEILGLQHVKETQQQQPAQRQQKGASSYAASSEMDQDLLPQFASQQWKERFASSLKQFEQLRRVEVMFTPATL